MSRELRKLERQTDANIQHIGAVAEIGKLLTMLSKRKQISKPQLLVYLERRVDEIKSKTNVKRR